MSAIPAVAAMFTGGESMTTASWIFFGIFAAAVLLVMFHRNRNKK